MMLRSPLLILLTAVVATSLAAQDASVPPAQLLRSALDYTRSAKGFRVKAEIEAEGKKSSVEAQVSGKDFELQTASGAKRFRSVGAKNWVSEDGGKTWQPSPNRESAQLATLLGPLELKGQPEVEKAGEETASNGKEKEQLSLLKVKAGNATAEYWIGWSQTKKALVRRFKGLAAGSTGTWVDARISWINATPAVEEPKQ